MERNIHAHDENTEWQLPDPGALTSAKAYRDKNALPLVERLKTVVKNLTVKCVQTVVEQAKELERTELYEKQNDLKGQKQQIGREFE